MKEVKMQNHLVQILKKYNLRRGLINKLVVNPLTFIFRDDADDELRWSYYKSVCKELKIKDRIIRFHGMDSEKASEKKIKGHVEEKLFQKYGLEVQYGTNKTDLIKDGNSYASLKGGKKIQWGMHVIKKLPKDLQELFGPWISTFKENSLYYKRLDFGNNIVNCLDNRELRRYLINYYFRKNEDVPYLIVKDIKDGTYYRITYTDLIDVLVENLEFYVTKDKVKVVGRMDLGNKKKMVIFEIEPRSCKSNYILMHGESSRIIKIIEKYNIDVKETYKQNAN